MVRRCGRTVSSRLLGSHCGGSGFADTAGVPAPVPEQAEGLAALLVQCVEAGLAVEIRRLVLILRVDVGVQFAAAVWVALYIAVSVVLCIEARVVLCIAALVARHTAVLVIRYIAAAAAHVGLIAQCIVAAVPSIGLVAPCGAEAVQRAVVIALHVGVATQRTAAEAQRIAGAPPVVLAQPAVGPCPLTDGTYLLTGEIGLLIGGTSPLTGEAYLLTDEPCPLTDGAYLWTDVGYLRAEGAERRARLVRWDVCPFGDPFLEPRDYLGRGETQSWKALAMKHGTLGSTFSQTVQPNSFRPRRLVKKFLRLLCRS